MKTWIVKSLALVSCLALLAGCGDNRKVGRNTAQQQDKAAVTLTEETGPFKTMAGKPARLFKVSVAVPADQAKREHLLIVVGDAGAVTMPNASTVDIGGKPSEQPVFARERNQVVAINAADVTKSQMIREFGTEDWRPELPADPNNPPPDPGFPMQLVKAKINGQTIQVEMLDKL